MNALTTPSAINAALARVCELLAEASTAEDVVEALDAADSLEAALRVMHERTAYADEVYASAWVVKQEAHRRLGEMTARLPKARRGPKPAIEDDFPNAGEISGPPKTEVLKRLGVSSAAASRYEKLAELPAEEFGARLAHARDMILEGKPPPNIAAVTSAEGFDKDAWETAPEVVAAERRVLGSIGLDPASNDNAQKSIQAERYYTKEDNGLIQPWKTDGGLHLNPPFSPKLVAQFARRWDELAGVDFAKGILIVNATTDTSWFQELMAKYLVCLTKRLPFVNPQTGELVDQNRVGQGIFYHGPEPKLFAREFRKFGEVMMRYTR